MDKYVAVWRQNDKIMRSNAYENKEVAVKYACRKIIGGYDAIVMTEAEFIERLGK